MIQVLSSSQKNPIYPCMGSAERQILLEITLVLLGWKTTDESNFHRQKEAKDFITDKSEA